MNNTEYITFCIFITEIMIIMDCKCYIEYRTKEKKKTNETVMDAMDNINESMHHHKQ